MNNRAEEFLRYARAKREADAPALDAAVKAGLERGRGARLDTRKLAGLALAYAAALALFIGSGSAPLAGLSYHRRGETFYSEARHRVVAEGLSALGESLARRLVPSRF